MHGYHDKLSLLTTKIAERLAALAPKPDRFRIIKEMLLRELSNQLYDMPQTQVALDMNEIMQESFHTTSARLEALHGKKHSQLNGGGSKVILAQTRRLSNSAALLRSPCATCI